MICEGTSAFVGGFVGCINCPSVFTNCTAYGDVSSSGGDYGGFMGRTFNSSAKIVDCAGYGNVIGSNGNYGKFAGRYFSGIVTNCLTAANRNAGMPLASNFSFVSEQVREVEYTPKGEIDAQGWVADFLAPRFRRPGETAADYVAKFEAKFGSDYSTVLDRENGKTGPGGVRLTVRSDYVAGTDPLDGDSLFRAWIEMTDGKPRISWTPDLNEGGTKSERVYRIFGKVSLSDGDWEEIEPRQVESYRFFTVSVELVRQGVLDY